MAEGNNDVLGGVLEITERGAGFLRQPKGNYSARSGDPLVPKEVIARYGLRAGMAVEGTCRKRGDTHNNKNKNKNRNNKRRRENAAVTLSEVQTVNGRPVDELCEQRRMEELTVIDPQERLRLEHADGPMEMRVMDIITPIGKGQRALLVAPPRTGKTVLLQQIATAVAVNHPEVWLLMLLIDERPEEVTDMRRSVHGEVVASNADQTADDHVRIVRLMIEVAKRRVEAGEDVVVLFDSLTRMGRAFNKYVGSTGRTMSGGLDIRALEEPKRVFGAARKIEDGGSLTIIATALVETNSRMDDVIFEEFKGTGNMELKLSRELADYRLYPAIDIRQSGTRKEERLYDEDTVNKINRVRRMLAGQKPRPAMEELLKRLSHHKTNAEFFAAMAT